MAGGSVGVSCRRVPSPGSAPTARDSGDGKALGLSYEASRAPSSKGKGSGDAATGSGGGGAAGGRACSAAGAPTKTSGEVSSRSTSVGKGGGFAFRLPLEECAAGSAMPRRGRSQRPQYAEIAKLVNPQWGQACCLSIPQSRSAAFDHPGSIPVAIAAATTAAVSTRMMCGPKLARV